MPEVGNLSNYGQVERIMEQFVEKTFLDQPFFRSLLAGEWSRPFLQYFAWQYAHYSANFPRVLGAAIAAMEPIDDWWIPLADNLWDEAGRGEPGRSHALIFRSFLVTVDPSARNLHPTPGRWPAMGEGVRGALHAFLEFFRNATPLEAMAAVGLGSELFAGRIMGVIGRGLRHPHYQTHGPLDTRFWDLHAMVDEPRHYQLCRNVLGQFASPQDLARMVEVGQAIAWSEAQMYQGIYLEGQGR
ncbi:MAG: iron-containing redox enzyme family protein [Thermaerobacter sp.]|nr:iron-containing redox enzyme family protein [Thermaerobacter sp.]